MAGAIHQALQEMRVTLEADEFDPSSASRVFTLPPTTTRHGLSSRHSFAMWPGLHLPPWWMFGRLTCHMLDQLDAGTVELALSALVEGGERFKCLGLLEDTYVAVMAHDHPVANEPALSMERLASLPHIAITSSGDDTNFVDDALAEQGLGGRMGKAAIAFAVVGVDQFPGSRGRAAAGRSGFHRVLPAHCPATAIFVASRVAFNDLAPPSG